MKSEQMESGLFPCLVDVGSFIDRGVFSIWGDGNPDTEQIVEEKNFPILSGNSFYARCLSGEWVVTGNPMKAKYGKATRLPAVPPCQLIVYSEQVPLTGSQIHLLIQDLLPNASRVEVSEVEFTRDLAGLSVDYFRRRMVHRAHKRKSVIDAAGRQTFYIGSRLSPLQVRIYDRTPDIVRFEVVLRRSFLVERGLCNPDELVRLRSLDLRPMFSLRKVSEARVFAATQQLTNDAVKQSLWDWNDAGRPLQKMYRVLRSNGIDPDSVLKVSSRQLQMELMQGNLIW